MQNILSIKVLKIIHSLKIKAKKFLGSNLRVVDSFQYCMLKLAKSIFYCFDLVFK